MNNIPSRKFVPAIIWFLIVMVLLFTPGSDLPKVDNWFNIPFFDKYVHVGIFAVLAFLFMYPFIKSDISPKSKRQYFIRIALAASVWGLTSEFIQLFFVEGRSFDLLDWAADSVGAALALFYCIRSNTSTNVN